MNVVESRLRCLFQRASLADHYVGEESMAYRNNVTLRHPLERGVVSQWEEMELVWNHAYHRLRASPEQQPVLMTDSVLNPSANRYRTVETLLETFTVPAVFVADTPSLCLYAVGSSTGLVLESGYSATYAVPVIKGAVMHSAVTRLDLGGNDLTIFLLRLVESRGSFFPPAKRELFAAVKEKLCYVARDYDEEEGALRDFARSSAMTRSYNLAGDTVTLQPERFQCPESLFQPSWLRVDAVGVHHLIHTAIDRCPPDTHHALYTNILLAGGNTCFPGFRQRLGVELSELCPPETHVSIHAPDNRQTLAWRGASEFCLSLDVADEWITAEEYRENGVGIVDRKRSVLTEHSENRERTKNNRCVADDSVRKNSNDWHHPVFDVSRTSCGVGGTTASRNTLYRGRKIFPSKPSVPSFHGNAIPGLPQPMSSGLRSGKLSRGTIFTTPAQGSNRGCIFSHHSVTSMLHVQKVGDDVRSPAPATCRNNEPCPRCPPQTPRVWTEDSDDDQGDNKYELAPLNLSAKSRRYDAENKTDFASFRKLSLFDHLMDEVSTFGSLVQPPSDSDDSDNSSWLTNQSQDSSVLDRMKEDELLPWHGLSGLRRNESIDIDQLKNPTSSGTKRASQVKAEPAGDSDCTRTRPGPVPEAAGDSDCTRTRPGSVPEAAGDSDCIQTWPGPVPTIHITTCLTPNSSVTSPCQQDPAAFTESPTSVQFLFQE